MAPFPTDAAWDASTDPPLLSPATPSPFVLRPRRLLGWFLAIINTGEITPGFVIRTQNWRQTLTAHENKLLFSWQT